MLDLFGLRKDIGEDAPELGPEAAKTPPDQGRASFWARLLLFDGIMLVLFGSALAWRVYVLLTAPPPPAQTRRLVRIKRIEPPPAKPAAQPPEAKAEKPAAAAAKPAPPGKGPVGSPSVNAPELPQRGTPVPAGSPKQATAAPSRKGSSGVKSVDFSFSAPDAKEVFLLGPFLVRTGGRKPLVKDSNGVWQISIYLNTGTTYRYRFEIIDSLGKKTFSPRQTLDAF